MSNKHLFDNLYKNRYSHYCEAAHLHDLHNFGSVCTNYIKAGLGLTENNFSTNLSMVAVLGVLRYVFHFLSLGFNCKKSFSVILCLNNILPMQGIMVTTIRVLHVIFVFLLLQLGFLLLGSHLGYQSLFSFAAAVKCIK